mgnify:CR=1 FL=1
MRDVIIACDFSDQEKLFEFLLFFEGLNPYLKLETSSCIQATYPASAFMRKRQISLRMQALLMKISLNISSTAA